MLLFINISMRFNSNDVQQLMARYLNLNESSVANMGVGTPAAVVVVAPGDNASGGSGKLKGPAPGHQSTIGGPGSENNEEECGSEAVEMAMNQLLVAANGALEIIEQLQRGKRLEAWAASKITLGSDYIQTVADYVKFEKNDSSPNVSMVPVEISTVTNVEDVTEAKVKQRLDPKCWKGYRKAGTKVKGGVRVNKCVKVKK
jgi:hypothetical protein